MGVKKSVNSKPSKIPSPSLEYENKLWQQGYKQVVGIDEVGRGAFAGPLVVGAVIFPKEVVLPEGLADSKMLKPQHRSKIADEIKKRAASWTVSEINVPVINKLGIGKATQMAFRKVIKLLNLKADAYLIDAFYIKRISRKHQVPVKEGDKICASIAAASIVAKVHRDKLMRRMHYKYPIYGFGKHKGYGTRLHQLAITKYGLTPIHRNSFIHFI